MPATLLASSPCQTCFSILLGCHCRPAQVALPRRFVTWDHKLGTLVYIDSSGYFGLRFADGTIGEYEAKHIKQVTRIGGGK